MGKSYNATRSATCETRGHVRCIMGFHCPADAVAEFSAHELLNSTALKEGRCGAIDLRSDMVSESHAFQLGIVVDRSRRQLSTRIALRSPPQDLELCR